jgi:hypothetical protein
MQRVRTRLACADLLELARLIGVLAQYNYL